MSVAMQLVINGLIAGSIYALIASGFSIIYSINKFMHFAHGGVLTVSAFMFYTFLKILDLNFWIAVTLTILFSGIFGLVLHLFVYRPLRKKNASNPILLIASLAIFIFLQSLMIAIFGADIKTVRTGEIAKGISIFGGIITPLQIVILIVSVAILIVLWFLMKKTKLGKAMRATADNPELSKTTGINPNKIFSLSFIIGSVIAGIAAILIGTEQNIEPNMGFSLMIKGFTGAIIGGVTSVFGAVLGSYLLGLVENIGIWFLPSGYKDAIAFFLLFIFLIFKPNGILGVSKGVRK
jgi:branched-chain amino acid transport system permease protein